ncbi:hypothetical protein DL93DRAFT_2088939 [Clavulina sp. PMI_390]|nr:hypothetical protein DL93DRAFT_2088939 [Clavulina sp. PMI_390]
MVRASGVQHSISLRPSVMKLLALTLASAKLPQTSQFQLTPESTSLDTKAKVRSATPPVSLTYIPSLLLRIGWKI